MFLLSWRFSTFAQQAEWVSGLLFKNHGQVLPMHNMLMQYLNHRESVAEKLLSYENKTRPVSGWIKSFIPGTAAFQARKEIANQLFCTKELYLKISIHYCQHLQHEQKCKDVSSHKKIFKSSELIKESPKLSNKPQRIFNDTMHQENISVLRRRF